jgi:hypothetical protein
LGYSAGRKTTIDVTDLIWKRARMAGFSLFAQSPTAIAAAWRDVIPLMVSGSVKPIVERVYPFGEAGEAFASSDRGSAVWQSRLEGMIDMTTGYLQLLHTHYTMGRSPYVGQSGLRERC